MPAISSTVNSVPAFELWLKWFEKKKLNWPLIRVNGHNPFPCIERGGHKLKAPYSAYIWSFIGCYDCRCHYMKNVFLSLLPSKGKERGPFWCYNLLCLHFGGNEFFFKIKYIVSVRECVYMMDVYIYIYRLSSDEESDTGCVHIQDMSFASWPSQNGFLNLVLCI